MDNANHSLVTHFMTIDDSAYAMMYSTFFDVLIESANGSERKGVDRDTFYDLLDLLSSDSSMKGLHVNAYTGFATDKGLFVLHYYVSKSEQEGVLKWEQTILEHERPNYLETLIKKPKGHLVVSAPGGTPQS